MKLNLGCGRNKLAGYVNVDKSGDPDVRHDLERFPWPWRDDSIEEVRATHVLEHLGRDPGIFIGVMKELYRICRHGAKVRIVVPHPRHDDFLGDPTHVRPVMPQTMALFSRQQNLQWQTARASNSLLALDYGVNFALRHVKFVLDEPYRADLKSGRTAATELERMMRECNNVVREVKMELEVIKD